MVLGKDFKNEKVILAKINDLISRKSSQRFGDLYKEPNNEKNNNWIGHQMSK